MKDKIQYVLHKLYDQTKIRIEVENEEIGKYAITCNINFMNNLFESKFIYKYDNHLTPHENIDRIISVIDKEIILDFYRR